MRCRKTTSYLNAYVDGEVPERLRRTVESHLAVCESCRGRLEEIRQVDELFQGSLPVPPVPDGFAARIMAEARRRQRAEISERSSPLPAWNPLQWIAGLSAPMRLAACATVLLALITGLSLYGGPFSGQNVIIEPERNLYGFEWFAAVPPGSIGSIYIAMADQPHEQGRGQ